MSDCGSSASRHEKSLGLLTTRFVSLLQDAKDGVLDLKVVSFALIIAISLEVRSQLSVLVVRRQILWQCDRSGESMTLLTCWKALV